MSDVNELLREGIIAKLKDYDAYIDNELPDYIMVMMANNKTMDQVNQDLQLFLGNHTSNFTAWLRQAIDSPDILQKPATTQETGSDSSISLNRKRRSREGSDSHKPHPSHVDEQEVEEPEEQPPSPKMSKMWSDRYGQEPDNRMLESESRRHSGEHRGEARVRSERPSLKRYEAPSSKYTAKRPVRAQPDSTRDQDLRELIGGRRRYHGGHHPLPQQQQQQVVEWGKGQRGQSEDEEGEIEEDVEEEEEEEGLAIPTTTVASVVKLIERPRPKRTDVGGSRLLHRAILGLAKRSKTAPKRGVARRPVEMEKVILVPASMLSDVTSQKLVVTKMTSGARDGGDEPDHEVLRAYEDEDDDVDDDDDDDVVVNVDDEFEETLAMEGMTEATVAALKQVMGPRGGGIKVVTSSADVISPHVRGGGGGKDMDLRAIINQSRELGAAKMSPRFVVTLTGAGDIGKGLTAESEPAEVNAKWPGAWIGQVEEEVKRKSAKERLGTRQVAEVATEGEKRDPARGSSEMLERCRFWPNCKNGDSCPYHHPNVPCKLFPDCKYGNKCRFLHPQCKFNSGCTRMDCSYLHTAPRHMSQPQVFPQMIPTPAPAMFNPSFRRPYSSGPSRMRYQKKKSAFSWKPHISERQFAVPDEQSNNLS